MKKLFLLSAGLAVIVSGCTTGGGTRMSHGVYQPTHAASVAILFEKPGTPYFVVGAVSAFGAPAASEDAVYRAMQKEAAELGAHAIIILDGTGIRESSAHMFGGADKKGKALAIRYGADIQGGGGFSLTPTSATPTTPRAEQVIPGR
ncbi:MAG: hypothetical protein LBD30_09315 [Verrucomicrobiales bacterium]|nr:hypothetical protein [Verrucomicrobiales bacterium]